ncbi:MAG: CAP domain-containing protein [Anaerolineae bacterium]
MQDRLIVVMLLVVTLVMFSGPAPAVAAPPDTGLEPLVNQWRAELGVEPLQGDERLYAAAQEVAGDGSYCPQDRMFIEFAIGGAMYRNGYHDLRGYGLVLCGEYPTPQDVMDWVRAHGGPGHPDFKDIGVVHLQGLDFARRNGKHVADIWTVLVGAPMQ